MAEPVQRIRKTPPMTLAQVRGFIAALGTAYPDAQTELDSESPYHLLCAVVMSAQTTDAAVNRVGPKRTNQATALENVAQQIPGAFGIAILGALLTSQ